MDANHVGNMTRIAINFRSERTEESPAWERAGMIALEQAEAELEGDGLFISLEQGTAAEGEGTRGFTDTLIVNIISDAITTLLFRAVTDLILRWKRIRTQRAPTALSGTDDKGCNIILHSGDSQIKIASGTSEPQIYEQLTLWAPHVLKAGNVTFELTDKEA